jgi:hypothetical protein
MADKIDLVYDLVKEVREEQKVQANHIEINKDTLVEQKVILEEHQRRAVANEKRLDILEDKVKRPLFNWEWFKKNLTWLVTFGGLLATAWAKWKGLF